MGLKAAMPRLTVLLPGIVAGVAALVAIPAAQARDIHYGAVSDARLGQCDTAEWQGKQADARTCYRSVLQASPDPAIRAEAMWALGDLKSANDLFKQAAAAQPKSSRVRARWARLFIDTHQEQDAMMLYEEALELDEDDAYAAVGTAEVLAGRFESKAAELLDPIVDNDKAPVGARIKALLLKSYLALENDHADEAQKLLDQADALAMPAKLPQLEIDELRAALDYSRGLKESPWVAHALKENPHFGGVHATPAYFFMIKRRMREAIDLYEKAVAVQPDLWDARVELGSNLLRDNQVTLAREHLEAAYKGDPYNPRTVNTLRLLDSFSNFDLKLFPEPVTPAAGSAAALTKPEIMMRLHKKESAVLERYVRKLAMQGIDTFAKRYNFKLEEPVVIELYPDHEDFAVRTAGMPGLGLLGATFGYLLAMDSPSSRAVNEFHWGSTLWHEMAHVFTLSATEHRVPRWFSEGVSVFEEWRTGPIKGILIPGYVFEAFKDGKMLAVDKLDEGFIRPEYPQQVMVSYMQAGLVCEFIDREFGFDKLSLMLTRYRRGEDTAAAIQSALGVSPAAFDARFKSFVNAQFGSVLAGLEDWKAAKKIAAEALAKSDWETAITAAKRAIAIMPQDVEAGSPYVLLARVYVEAKQRDQALATLEDYWKRGGYDPQALRALADRLYAVQRRDDAVAVMQSINYVAPFDYDQHGLLGDWLLELGRPQDALDEFSVALALNAPDKAGTHYRLAQAYIALEKPQDARKHLIAALEVAPGYRPAQKMLLELSRPN